MSGNRKILQFGTSRFLQAHVDLFVHEARLAGQAVGPITVVKTTGDQSRDARIGALAEGYPVIIRGLVKGRAEERTLRITSVTRALSLAASPQAVCDEALAADIFLSNTGEAGYAIPPEDRAPGLPVPLEHPDVVMTDDLEPYERLKLHILNLGHTVLADLWHRTRRPAGETVRQILADPDVAARLDQLYAEEVLPGFAARGLGERADAYVATTIDRFRNPFLDHAIADIHGNHRLKIERRITAFKAWIREAGASHRTPILDAVEAGQN